MAIPMPFESVTGVSAPGSVVTLPDIDRIKLELPNTTIIIQEGKV